MQVDVPIFRQEQESWCGLACLQMILSHRGIDKTQTQLAEEIWGEASPTRLATMGEMTQYLQSLGLVSVCVASETKLGGLQLLFGGIARSLENGYPVIVNVQPGGCNNGHFRVLTAIEGADLYFNEPCGFTRFDGTVLPEVLIQEVNDFYEEWTGPVLGTPHACLMLCPEVVRHVEDILAQDDK